MYKLWKFGVHIEDIVMSFTNKSIWGSLQSKQNWPLLTGPCCLLSVSLIFGWALCWSSAASGSLRPAVPSRWVWPGCSGKESLPASLLHGTSQRLFFFFSFSFLNGKLLAPEFWPCSNIHLAVGFPFTSEDNFYFGRTSFSPLQESRFIPWYIGLKPNPKAKKYN